MGVLRWLFLAACFGCVVVVARDGRWEGYLSQVHHIWIVDLEQAPVWDPPDMPSYARFREEFRGVEGFPSEGSPGKSIRRVLRWDWMAVDLLLSLWPVTVVGGLLYLVGRRGRRDLILHCGLSVGIGLSVAALMCMGFWLLLGGWGPPAPEFFGGLGLVLGLLGGLASFKRVRA